MVQIVRSGRVTRADEGLADRWFLLNDDFQCHGPSP